MLEFLWYPMVPLVPFFQKENEMLKSDAAEKTRELSAQKSQATKLQADVNKLHEDLSKIL